MHGRGAEGEQSAWNGDACGCGGVGGRARERMLAVAAGGRGKARDEARLWLRWSLGGARGRMLRSRRAGVERRATKRACGCGGVWGESARTNACGCGRRAWKGARRNAPVAAVGFGGRARGRNACGCGGRAWKGARRNAPVAAVGFGGTGRAKRLRSRQAGVEGRATKRLWLRWSSGEARGRNVCGCGRRALNACDETPVAAVEFGG
jgi:hypothetical protein